MKLLRFQKRILRKMELKPQHLIYQRMGSRVPQAHFITQMEVKSKKDGINQMGNLMWI
ncbi:hypothetical protein CLHUN_43060 [Ruminiclostridium hungatei]|uniref:Uncharacterized protein n=1 Tax=Ruminiclostridium hungatei TaxID=48256 RepID=A0A1V4SDC9_RUMHU|nr:hypothetical protein CLHUN_43060 [Ruminiclostridium hungatei]